MIEKVRTSETLISFYHTTLCSITEGNHLSIQPIALHGLCTKQRLDRWKNNCWEHLDRLINWRIHLSIHPPTYLANQPINKTHSLTLRAVSSLKVESHSVGQNIPFLRNSKVHYHVYKSLPLGPILSQLKPVQSSHFNPTILPTSLVLYRTVSW
jgi:hypothetical protein